MGLITLDIPWGVVRAFPSIMVDIIAALVVWAILQIVESFESIRVGWAAFAPSSALSGE
jgi:hypothetical protein